MRKRTQEVVGSNQVLVSRKEWSPSRTGNPYSTRNSLGNPKRAAERLEVGPFFQKPMLCSGSCPPFAVVRACLPGDQPLEEGKGVHCRRLSGEQRPGPRSALTLAPGALHERQPPRHRPISPEPQEEAAFAIPTEATQLIPLPQYAPRCAASRL